MEMNDADVLPVNTEGLCVRRPAGRAARLTNLIYSKPAGLYLAGGWPSLSRLIEQHSAESFHSDSSNNNKYDDNDNHNRRPGAGREKR